MFDRIKGIETMSDNVLLERILKIDSERYKFSCYNIIKRVNDGSLLLFNARTGAFSIILSKFFGKLDNNEEILSNLLANGFIVDKRKNEIEEIIMNFKKIKDDKTILRLIILPAETCNFRCTYCYETFRNITISEKIASGIINFIKRNIKAIKILEISWFGGEPLLEADRVIAITKTSQNLAKTYGVKFLSDITTNGYLLNRSLIKNLIDAGITGYQITIDGIPSIHNRFRKLKNGRGTFNEIWSNIKHFKEIDENIYVIIRTNFDDNSYRNLDEWINLYRSEFEKDHRVRLLFRPIFKTGTERDNQIKFCPLKKSAEIESEILMKIWEKLGFPIWYFEEVMLPKPKAIYCYGGLSGCFVIGADGTLWKCTVALKQEYALGYLKENGEIVINDGYLYKWNKYVDSWTYDETCRKCFSLPLCMGGCVLTRKQGRKGCYISFFSITKMMDVYYKNIMKGGD